MKNNLRKFNNFLKKNNPLFINSKFVLLNILFFKYKLYYLIKKNICLKFIYYFFIIDYCKSPKNDIQLFIIKSIDRFTRGGSYLYDHLKMQLVRDHVQLIDIYGIIGNQEVNTLEHLGIEYNWSVYSPTKKSEILEAE